MIFGSANISPNVLRLDMCISIRLVLLARASTAVQFVCIMSSAATSSGRFFRICFGAWCARSGTVRIWRAYNNISAGILTAEKGIDVTRGGSMFVLDCLRISLGDFLLGCLIFYLLVYILLCIFDRSEGE